MEGRKSGGSKFRAIGKLDNQNRTALIAKDQHHPVCFCQHLFP